MKKMCFVILLAAAMLNTAACGNAHNDSVITDTPTLKQAETVPTEEAGYEAVSTGLSTDEVLSAEGKDSISEEIAEATGSSTSAPSQNTSTEEPTAAVFTTTAATTKQTQTTQNVTATQSQTTQTQASTQQTTTKSPTTAKQTTTQTPATAKQTTTQAPTTATAADPNSYKDTYVDQVIKLINEERSKEGLNPVTKSVVLTEAAQTRAKECVQVFSHTRPNGNDCFSIISEMGYSAYALGENIAAGQQIPEEVMESWMNSSGHRANILDPDFTEVGIGYYYEPNDTYHYYWVQMFGWNVTKE